MRRLSILVLCGSLALWQVSASAAPVASDTTVEATPASPSTAAETPAPATAPAAPADPAPVAAAAPAPPPQPTLHVNINLTTQRMVVTENGQAKYTWAVSSGAYGYPTPVGSFNPTWMSKMWYSKQYDNAPMPHAIFFRNGAAIHATSSVRLLGTPASHGCVRLAPSNAAKLFALVSRHGKSRTEIKVHGRPKYTAPKIAKSRPAAPRMRHAASPYRYGYQSYAAPRYVYPGDAPPRYYIQTNRQRAAALKKRRAATRQYYSAY